MAAPDGRFGANAGSTLMNQPLEAHHILQDGIPTTQIFSALEDGNGPQEMRKSKSRGEHGTGGHRKAHSISSKTTDISSSTQIEQPAEHRDVRTLPPWIDSFETENDEHPHAQPTDRLLAPPSRTHNAQHHFAAAKTDRRMSQDGYVESDDDASEGTVAVRAKTGLFGREPDRGRKWDHAREGDPVIMQSGITQSSSPWTAFIRSSMYGPSAVEDVRRVDNAFLEAQTPGYQNPWRGDVGDDDPEKALGLLHIRRRQKLWYQKLQHVLLMHPLVPLAFRLTVLTTSVIALALSISTYNKTKSNQPDVNNTSTLMAIVVDVIAIPYICYITWDEYKGKPLGLRAPKAKIRLVLLDLFFIIFESANLALAFAALNDKTHSCVGDFSCDKAEALAVILLIALIAWTLTFTVSIFRLVERVGGREEGD